MLHTRGRTEGSHNAGSSVSVPLRKGGSLHQGISQSHRCDTSKSTRKGVDRRFRHHGSNSKMLWRVAEGSQQPTTIYSTKRFHAAKQDQHHLPCSLMTNKLWTSADARVARSSSAAQVCHKSVHCILSLRRRGRTFGSRLQSRCKTNQQNPSQNSLLPMLWPEVSDSAACDRVRCTIHASSSCTGN